MVGRDSVARDDRHRRRYYRIQGRLRTPATRNTARRGPRSSAEPRLGLVLVGRARPGWIRTRRTRRGEASMTSRTVPLSVVSRSPGLRDGLRQRHAEPGDGRPVLADRQVEVEVAVDLADRAPSPGPGSCPAGSRVKNCSGTSSSLMMSPTSSSIRSSVVTRPDSPPCSSTTTAIWVRRRCISRRRSSARVDSGHLVRRAQDVLEHDQALLPGEREHVARDDVADDVVDAAVVDRHAAVALLEDHALDLLGRRAAAERDDARARHHDLGDGDLAEAERARRDLARPRIDRAGLRGLLDELLELVARQPRLGERGLVAEEPQERGSTTAVSDPDDRPQHAATMSSSGRATKNE